MSDHQDKLAPLAGFKAKKLESWMGLAPGTTRVDVEAAWNTELIGNAKGFLGRQVRQLNFSAANLEGFPLPLQVWYEGEKVVKIRADLPNLPLSPRDYFMRFAVEPIRLNFDWGGLLVEMGEWVFPARGISLFCDPEFDQVVTVDVFSPVTEAEYLADFYFYEPEREFPER